MKPGTNIYSYYRVERKSIYVFTQVEMGYLRRELVRVYGVEIILERAR